MRSSKLTYKYGNQLIAEYSEEVSSLKIAEYPLVSVCFQTYNHAKFIEEALDSVLIQETSFPFEILIGDDASTDGTSEIIDRYQREHPDKIKILRSTKNLGKYTGNGRLNLIRNLRACRGKYIALLEGDDYWLCDHKLKFQVEALEANSHYSCSFHDTYVSFDNKPEEMIPWRDFSCIPLMKISDIIAPRSPFHTSSFMARSSCFEALPSCWLHSQSGDLVLFIESAVHGNAVKVKDIWSVYRKHPGGITNDARHKGDHFHKARLKMHKALRKHYRKNKQVAPELFDSTIKHHRRCIK